MAKEKAHAAKRIVMNNRVIDGNWEEEYVKGIRIEAKYPDIVFFWLNRETLITKFKLKKDNEKFRVDLKDNGLRNSPNEPPYAVIEDIYFANDSIVLKENFKIAGLKETTLKKTENSKYGNVEICDDVFKKAKGKWVTTDNAISIEFKKNLMVLNGVETKIHFVRPRESKEEIYQIVSEEGYIYEMQGFYDFVYFEDTITFKMIVFDAEPISFKAHKQ